ncbi:MAG: HAD-IIA family hydrolase [Bacillota bacterium]
MTTQAELKHKKLFLLDMDGTIYIDNTLFDKTLDFLDYIKSVGGKYIFITNNSSKSVNDYIDKLQRMSIDVDLTNFLTSSQATAVFLQEKYPNKKIYVLGTESLKTEFKNANIKVTDKYEEDIDLLVAGFDTELVYQKLHDACVLLLTKDVDFIATNPDLVCPTSFGSIPDCGSICRMLETATGRAPFYVGKPNPMMIDMAIKKSGFTKDETLVIGDRIYTDIASGLNAGVDAALVLSGETKLEDLKNFSQKPDFIFKDIGELLSVLLSSN